MLTNKFSYSIDGKTYSTNDFSDNVEGGITSIQFADNAISEMTLELKALMMLRQEVVMSLKKYL